MKNAIAILALAAALFGVSVEWASASHGPSERNWCSSTWATTALPADRPHKEPDVSSSRRAVFISASTGLAGSHDFV
jgi:hypothetical protein